MRKCSTPMSSPDLAERITGHALTKRDLKWIARRLPTATNNFARLLILILLLDAWKRRQQNP